MILGIIISLAAFILFYTLCAFSLVKCGLIETLRKFTKKEILITAFIAIAIILLALAWMSKENYIYFWDYKEYWYNSITLDQTLYSNPITALNNIYNSTLSSNYNYLISFVTSLPMKIMGLKYESFVLVNIVMFQIPANLTLSFIFHKILSDKQIKVKFYWLFILASIISIAYIPTLNGYVDVACYFIALILICLLIDIDVTKFNFKKAVIIACLLVLIVLMRRYFAYFVVGYIAGYIGMYVTTLFYKENRNRKRIKMMLIGFSKNILCIIGIPLAILFIFFREFLLRSVFNNYSVAYSAYQNGNLFENFQLLSIYLGLFITIAAIAGIIFCIISKKTRAFSVFLLISILCSCILFFMTQSMSNQHYYIILAQFSVLLFIALFNIIELSKKTKIKAIPVCLTGIAAIALSLNFSYSLSNPLNLDNSSHILGSVVIYPRTRNDITQLQSMVNEVRILSNDKLKIIVTASSFILNDDIIRSIDMPASLISLPTQVHMTDIDLRDGFPIDFLNADIVIATIPTQYHTRKQDQQVVGVLNEEITNGGSIGNHFKLVKEYTLDKDVIAQVYVKVTPFSEQDIAYLRNIFDKIYPEYPELFHDRIQ